MFGRKRVLRAISVLSVALAAGHLVETLRASALPGHLSMGSVASGPLSLDGADRPTLPKSASLSAQGFGDLPPLMGIVPVSSEPGARSDGACTPSLQLAVAPQAMIDLVLSAPCNPGQRVVLRHAGISFTAQTGAEGRVGLRIPALDAEALVTAYFEGSEVALASVEVPELAGLARFAVQAPQPLQFDLRANEGGRVYSGKGALAAPDGSRKIVTLGSGAVPQPVLAQVYTFPRAEVDEAALTVELRVTAETCGHTFQAETVLSQDGKAVRKSIPLAMPLCGASGDILMLKNLVSEPTLDASN